MKFIADFHIHSHYSIATSKYLIPEYLDLWARFKGIKVIGTGDFTHPGWLKELTEKLEPAEEGLYKLKSQYRKKITLRLPEISNDSVRFLLSAEISTIYKKNNHVRKVHHVLFAPDYSTVEKIQKTLSKFNFNITSDGRPILGLDSQDLLKMVLDISDQVTFIPAHIWTPWFSSLGSKSGFDSIEECYGDLAQYLFAVETGLSSDPPMNWLCSFLDRYTLISNSDAHSPEKLGREANLFDTGLSYREIVHAIKNKALGQFLGTIEFFPQEGKYHHDGHRKCNISWNPKETIKHNGICPICNKPVTIGVMNRVIQLSDRRHLNECQSKSSFYSLIPLKEILAEILGVGPHSKQVTRYYNVLLEKLGPELHILVDLNISEIQNIGNDLLTEAIRRMRSGDVIIKEGYDGEYGRIKVFREDEFEEHHGTNSLFGFNAKSEDTRQQNNQSNLINTDKYPLLQKSKERIIPKKNQINVQKSKTIQRKPSGQLDPNQMKAVQHFKGPALIVAGPGTGKTRVLTYRIAHLIEKIFIKPDNILAITFTNKAAKEISLRLLHILSPPDNQPKCHISTFHRFGLTILKNHIDFTNRKKDFTIIDEEDKEYILRQYLKIDQDRLRNLISDISEIKRKVINPENIIEEKLREDFIQYENYLQKFNIFDFDDLIIYSIRLLQENDQILSDIRKQFQWILVDEYQDINFGQYLLIHLLAPDPNSNLFIIGDVNQAIYGFRGADTQFISRFIQDYPQATIYHLTQSYRCTNIILKASGQIIKDMSNPGEWSLQGIQQGLKINISQHGSEKSEAEFVARTIEKMMGGLRFFSMDSAISEGNGYSDIMSFSDFCVLCRISHQMGPIQKAFNDHSIPYQTISEKPFFKEEPVKSLIDILKYLRNPTNNFLKDKYLKKLISINNLNTLQKEIEELPIKDILLQIIGFHSNSTSLIQQEPVQKLLQLSEQYGDYIEAFFECVTLGNGIDIFQDNLENVNLLTMHSAKGLEFPCVFIIGCEDGILPYTIFPNQQSNPEEEKRLLYVGMTRAKKYLFLTHTKKRFLFGKEYHLEKSQFLEPIEKELIEVDQNHYKKKTIKKNDQLKLF